MKTWLKISFVFVFVLSLAFTARPSNVQAISLAGVAPGSWDSSGVPSSEIPMNLVTTPGPAWLQLLTNGLNLSAPATICHPFRGEQFGWTGEIRMLNGGTWVKLPTSVKWSPTGEGKLIACATAPAAGTYALFGYFDKAKAPVVECEYDTSAWSVNIYGGSEVYFYARVDNIPADTLVTYRVIVPDFNLIVATTGSTISHGTVGYMYADFTEPLVWEQPWSQVTLRISALGCSKDVVYTYYPVDD
jgi:hypothetical protein